MQREANMGIKSDGCERKMGLDIIGLLNEIEDGFKYILTCIDVFSRTEDAIALRSKDSISICRVIEQIWFKKHSIIKEILIDNGRKFSNLSFYNMACANDIEIKHGAPYHPQTTGPWNAIIGL